MNALTEHVRHGAEQAWSSLAEGWHALRARASGALTRFRPHARPPGEASADDVERFAVADWGLMAADIRVDENRVVVRVEAPGLRREDLHIDIDGERLSVWGEKRLDIEERDGDYDLVQCAYGSFQRDILLPRAVDADRATASYRDGVLRIELPRVPGSRGRRIAVQGA